MKGMNFSHLLLRSIGSWLEAFRGDVSGERAVAGPRLMLRVNNRTSVLGNRILYTTSEQCPSVNGTKLSNRGIKSKLRIEHKFGTM
jgi:hypothetical protein